MKYQTKQERTKFYMSGAWRGVNGIRQKKLREANYECEWCKKQGKVTTADRDTLEVDHIEELDKRPDLALEEDNLRVLCRTCHNIRHGRFQKKKEDEWQDEKW